MEEFICFISPVILFAFVVWLVFLPFLISNIILFKKNKKGTGEIKK